MLRYYQYFGLQRDPFLDTPDPQFYFEAPVVRQDLRRVLKGIDEADGVTAVIGASGSGKTSLFTKVEQVLLGDDTAIVGKIFEPTFSSDVDLLTAIGRVFGLRTKSRSNAELTNALKNFMLDRVVVENRTVVLLVDEAHNFNTECLETLRFLHNLQTPEHRLLTLVLFGHPQLAAVLGGRGRFNDRTDRHVHLAPLDPASSAAIIEYRLTRAGKEPAVRLIAPAALEAAVAAGGGLPRALIEIVRAAMIEAARRGAEAVAGDHVAAALRARAMRSSSTKGIARVKLRRFGVAEALDGASDPRPANLRANGHAEKRLVGMQRDPGRLPPYIAGSTTYSDRPANGKAAQSTQPPSGAILVATVDAHPRSALIPGALVTISVSVANDGDSAAGNVRLTLPLPLDTAYRPGTLVVDGLTADDALAGELFGDGALLGELATGARRSLCATLLVEPGLEDLTLSPHVSAASAAVLGPRALRLSRAAPVRERAPAERPFYEVDDDEDAREFAAAAAFAQPARPAAPSARAAQPPAAVRPAAAAESAASGPTAAASRSASPTVEQPAATAAGAAVTPRIDGIRSVSTSTPAVPISAARERLEKAKSVKTPLRRRTLAPSEPVSPPAALLEAAAIRHPGADQMPSSGEPAPPIGEGRAPVPAVTVFHAVAAAKNGTYASDANITVLPRPEAARPRYLREAAAEQPGPAKIEVVRSVEGSTAIEALGGPVLSVRIDRRRLTTLSALFGGASLGMIAHYLVLNALAVHQPLPGDDGDESLAAFVAQQEKLLSRALIATRLGKTPAPESVAAPLPAFPTMLASRSERCEIEIPASGSALLVRPFEPSEVRFVERMLANDGAAPFMRAAQLFVGLCAADVAVADDRVRRDAAQALKSYSALATAEVSRIFLRAKLSSVPDLFKPTDDAFDDAARSVLAALGRAIG